MDAIERRVDRIESRLESNDSRHGDLKSDVSEQKAAVATLTKDVTDLKIEVASLKAFRDNEKAKHSATPAWLFGTISAVLSIIGFLFTLYLSGVKVP